MTVCAPALNCSPTPSCYFLCGKNFWSVSDSLIVIGVFGPFLLETNLLSCNFLEIYSFHPSFQVYWHEIIAFFCPLNPVKFMSFSFLMLLFLSPPQGILPEVCLNFFKEVVLDFKTYFLCFSLLLSKFIF